MSTPSTVTWALVPPYRPGIGDLGGGQKVQRAGAPPDPVRMITADDVNQWANQIACLGAVIPVLKVSIHGLATPAVSQFISPIPGLTLGTFTVTRNGTGDVSITWPAGTFPAAAVDPECHVTGATAGNAVAQAIANGVRVRTSVSGTPTDLTFNATVY